MLLGNASYANTLSKITAANTYDLELIGAMNRSICLRDTDIAEIVARYV